MRLPLLLAITKYPDGFVTPIQLLQDWRLCLRLQLNLAKYCDRFKTNSNNL